MTNFDKIFDSFNNKKILIIGDVMIDSYMIGNVDRISPEAPIPIIAIAKKENRLGGAANVALNIKALGAEPILCSVIGDDENSKIFLNLLKNSDLGATGIISDKSRVTTVKTRIISKNQHLLRVDEEITNDIEARLENIVLIFFNEIIYANKIDSIIIQDYNKGVLTQKVIKEVIKLANENKIPILVDPKFKNFELYKNVTILKPNFKEFSIATNTKFNKSDTIDIANAGLEFIKNNNIKSLIITLSENGILVCENKAFVHFQALDVDIADVSGAGDTVIATLSLCRAVDLDDKLSSFIANISGSLVCEKVGVVQINKDYLLQNCKLFQTQYESKK